VNRFTKRTNVALKRLGDQSVRNGFKLGIQDCLKPTPTLIALRAELGLPGQAATSALLLGESMGGDATPDEVCIWCVLRCGLDK
jgi:hypothetical protein